MNTKLIVLLLGAITLVHLCAARPEPNSKSSEELNEVEKKVELKDRIVTFLEKILKEKNLCNDRFKTFVTIISEYAMYVQDAVEQATKICRLMMTEPFIEKLDTEDIYARAEDFSDFVTTAESLEKNVKRDPASDLFDLFDRFSTIMDNYNLTMLTEPTKEDVLFSLALEKNGIKEINTKINEGFAKFLVKMFKIVDEFIAKLSTEEKEAETELIEFMPKYKARDINDQRKNIKDFMVLFKLTNSSSEKVEEGKNTTE